MLKAYETTNITNEYTEQQAAQAATMRPTTPQFNFAPQAEPSSPPQTPTTDTFRYRQYKTRRNGIANFSNPFPNGFPSEDETIPTNGPQAFFSQPIDVSLSPRSSSPSSTHSSASSCSPPRSLSSSPGADVQVPNTPQARHIIAETSATFIIEEFGNSDYEDFDSDVESTIQPHQYEDAESDCAPSVKATPVKLSHIDPQVLSGIKNLQCQADAAGSDQDIYDEEERQAWIEMKRAEKRRKRRSSSSFQKRTHAQSIGSDTDDEDLQPITFEGANEAGSSARRLKRKLAGERTSLIFDDPPARIEELEEPESCEELVEIEAGEEESNGFRNLPFYVQDSDDDDMDIDSDED